MSASFLFFYFVHLGEREPNTKSFPSEPGEMGRSQTDPSRGMRGGPLCVYVTGEMVRCECAFLKTQGEALFPTNLCNLTLSREPSASPLWVLCLRFLPLPVLPPTPPLPPPTLSLFFFRFPSATDKEVDPSTERRGTRPK